MKKEIFRMERVTYKEDEVMKLEDFNLQIYQGEIMGMVPLNNHGLNGFLKLLQMNLPVYDGYVYYHGEKINSWKESSRGHNRISIIQARSSLVEQMSITDNIFVLRKGFRQEIIRTNLLNRQLTPFLKDIGIEIPLDAKVEQLSVFERVVVELLRAVVAGNRLIVLNEIGALISYDELEKLHSILHHYVAKGTSFLYICPHFEEISRICDRAALMSNGRIQKIVRKEELADEVLKVYPAEYDRMVRYYLENRRKNTEKKGAVFSWNSYNEVVGKNISFTVNRGECLAVQIQEGRILHEVFQMLAGEIPPEKGSAFIEGKETDFISDSRVAVIKELPTKTMLFPELDYIDNLCISLSRRISSVWRNDKIRNSIRREYSLILGEEVFDMQVEDLSEKQKYQLIYTRVLLQKPKIVFCVHPFQGADVTHRMVIWKLLENLLDNGIAVVILSLGLSDSLSLAERLLTIESDGTTSEVRWEEFSSISSQVPWRHIYEKYK